MAVPKRKTTKSRSGKRRSHLKVSTKNIIEDKKLKWHNLKAVNFKNLWNNAKKLINED